ncbi:MAG: hypothetical protein QM656_03345 [Paracoccaceae bacterium]
MKHVLLPQHDRGFVLSRNVVFQRSRRGLFHRPSAPRDRQQGYKSRPDDDFTGDRVAIDQRPPLHHLPKFVCGHPPVRTTMQNTEKGVILCLGLVVAALEMQRQHSDGAGYQKHTPKNSGVPHGLCRRYRHARGSRRSAAGSDKFQKPRVIQSREDHRLPRHRQRPRCRGFGFAEKGKEAHQITSIPRSS